MKFLARKDTFFLKNNIYYHIVWCVKYRHKILLNEVKDDFIDIITNICRNNNYELVEINTDKDYVHILLGLSPQDSIPVVMKTLKGVSARLLNQKHKSEISKVLYGVHHIILPLLMII